MYIKQEHALKNGWGLNYGINYKTSKDNSYQAYFKVDNESATLPENTNGHKRENIINIFTGLNKNFNNKIIINASIAAEYYNNTFWNKWNFLPAINATLMPAQAISCNSASAATAHILNTGPFKTLQDTTTVVMA